MRVRAAFGRRGATARAIVLAPALVVAGAARSSAQGGSTASISGVVRSASEGAVDGAQVHVLNPATGYSLQATTRRGRYFLSGLEVGGPYVVTVRRLGFAPQRRDSVFLTLGEPRPLDFVLEPAARALDVVVVAVEEASISPAARTGAGGTISDSLLHRLPLLDRHVFDLVRLVPQVSTRFGGISGGGASFRFNGYLLDGVSERQLQGNHVAGGAAGGKAISVEAVKEYQVLLAPYDARYGDFAGALVNAVTRGGTNDVRGTAFVYARNEALARDTPFLRDTPYDRAQFGLAVGGPIVRDRAHFFVASELQRMRQPAGGPYLEPGAASPNPAPVSARDVDRFAAVLRDHGLDPGSGGRVTNANPQVNVFGRVDVAVPEWGSRVVLRHNFADSDNTRFARPVATSSFPLSSNASTLGVTRRATALQLFTQLTEGAFNELLVAYTTYPFGAVPATVSPLVQVTVPRTDGTGTAALLAGPAEGAQGGTTVQRTVEIGDHLVLRPGPAHTLGLGARAELFSYHLTATAGRFGQWTFSSLDSLARGEAASFRVARDFGGAAARLRGAQVSAYVNEEWQATERLSVTAGVRADLLAFDGRPAYNPAVDSDFGRRTSDFPTSRVHWSPRLGFSWDLHADRRARVRGGAGVFVGRPPLGWFLAPFRSDGLGIRTLSCPGGVSGPAIVPPFTPDPRNPPTACANGRGFADGAVALVDRRLRMAEAFRASLAYDRRLPWGAAASVEALYTRTLSDFVFANLNLVGPQGVDRHGRVLYGTIDTLGQATPALVTRRFVGFVGPQRPQVFDLRNHSKGHSYSLTARLDKRFADRLEASASYTHSRVRDVRSLVAEAALIPFNNWAAGGPVSGRHDDLRTGVSAYDLPHRVVLAATWAAPWAARWQRWATGLSVYYVGESGTPFTYIDSAGGGLGDLNADGTNANDPVYVPRDAADTAEIAFGGSPADVLRQQAAFERFVAGTACLRRQRGRIVARNSCRGAWVHMTNASVRQSLPPFWGHRVSLQLDVFNVLNLLHADWGLYRVPNAVLLQQVGQTAGPASSSQPVFRFDGTRPRHNTQNVESAYQLQLALRYSF